MEQDIENRVQKARSESTIGGLIKFMYYISPVGYLFNYPQHKLCRDVTFAVWNKS